MTAIADRQPRWRIGIDAHMVGTGETGNETYVRGLARGLQRVDHHNAYLLYTTDPALLPRQLLGERFQARRVTPASNLLRVGYALPRATRRDRIDLLHVTYTLPPALHCRAVVSVHDISYRFFPETFSLRDRLLLNLAVPWSMRRADRVITLSEAARRDIQRCYRLAERKVVAIPLAAEEHFAPVQDREALARVRAHYRLPEHFILAVGNLQPRKNLARLVEAFALVKREHDCPHQLALAGQARWRESVVDRAIERHGLANEVVLTGYVPDADLPALYSAADLFVYPSLYEGFGLPPLEAMACGTPVVTSATSSLPEVVGDAALTVEPTDTAALAAAMRRVLNDTQLRARLIAAGFERRRLFSWEKTAAATQRVYDEVLATPGDDRTRSTRRA